MTQSKVLDLELGALVNVADLDGLVAQVLSDTGSVVGNSRAMSCRIPGTQIPQEGSLEILEQKVEPTS